MAKLVVSLPDGSKIEHELNAEVTTIGRAGSNMLTIPEGSVSSHHAEIKRDGDKYVFRDLDSTNGSFLNGNSAKSAPLDEGDKLKLGSVECEFVGDAPARPETLPKPPRELPKVPKFSPPAAA